MTMTEARSTLRTWFDNGGGSKVTAANMKKRNTVNATFIAVFEMSETDLKFMFDTKGYDVIFVIKKVRTSPIIRGRDTIGYEQFVGVQPVVVNKFIAGTMNVEGSEMLGKALDEIRRILRAEIDTGGTVVLSSEQPSIERAGSTLLYGDTCIIRYDQFV